MPDQSYAKRVSLIDRKFQSKQKRDELPDILQWRQFTIDIGIAWYNLSQALQRRLVYLDDLKTLDALICVGYRRIPLLWYVSQWWLRLFKQ